MEAHCIEYHDPHDNATIQYGEAVVDCEHADDLQVVSFIQQALEACDSDVDAIEDVVSYEEPGGEWSIREGASHGQMTGVLRLVGVEQQAEMDAGKENQTAGTATPTETETVVETTVANETNETVRGVRGTEEPMGQDGYGVGVVAIVVAVTLVVLRVRRGEDMPDLSFPKATHHVLRVKQKTRVRKQCEDFPIGIGSSLTRSTVVGTSKAVEWARTQTRTPRIQPGPHTSGHESSARTFL